MDKTTRSHLLLPRAKRHQSELSLRKELREARVEADHAGGVQVVEEVDAAMVVARASKEDLTQLQRNGIPQIMQDFRHPEVRGISGILRSTTATRKLLTVSQAGQGWRNTTDSSFQFDEITNDSLVKQMIDLGIVGELCKVLDNWPSSPRIQFEAVWAITNAAFTNSQVVAQSGAMQRVCNLLTSPHASTPLREQCLWSLGNFMSRNTKQRNFILQECGVAGESLPTTLCGILHRVHGMTEAEFLAQPQPSEALNLPGISPLPMQRETFLRQASWALASLVQGGNTSPQTLQQILPQTNTLLSIRDLILHSVDPIIVANLVWFLADLSELQSGIVLRLALVDRILELGMHSHVPVQAAVSQCIYNMCSNNNKRELEMRTLLLSRPGYLILLSHLQSERKELWQNASWTLSFACSKLPKLCLRLAPGPLHHIFQVICDAKYRSEIRQDCITIAAHVLLAPQAMREGGGAAAEEEQIYSNTVLPALVYLLEEGSGAALERDFTLLECALQLILVLKERNGRGFLFALEERGALRNLQRIQAALPQSAPAALEDLMELILTEFDRKEDEDAEEEEARYMPLVRTMSVAAADGDATASSATKNTNSQRTGYQTYAQE